MWLRSSFDCTNTDNCSELQVKESYGIALQDTIAVDGRKLKLIKDRRGIFDILRGEVVRADDDPVRADEAHQETEGLRVIDQIIVMKTAQVIPKRVFDRRSVVVHVKK